MKNIKKPFYEDRNKTKQVELQSEVEFDIKNKRIN